MTKVTVTELVICAVMTGIAAWGGGCAAGGANGDETVSGAITGGYDSPGTPMFNAAVKVVTPEWNCSGTLVAPDVVLTAGHCAGGKGPAWEDDTTMKGQWRAARPATISVGSQAQWVYQAHHYNQPGPEDSALWLLDQPVPATQAIPASYMTAAKYAEIGGLGTAELRAVGWGIGATTIEQMTYAWYASDGPRGPDTFGVRTSPGVLQGGDSGGALFFWSGAEGRFYALGDYQGPTGGVDSYVGTFKTGGGDPALVNVSAWLTSAVGPSTTGPRRNRFVPSSSGDNWAGDACPGTDVCLTGDFDGDRKFDTLAISPSSGRALVGTSYGFRTFSLATSTYPQAGKGFEVTTWSDSVTVAGETNRFAVGDMNGDGRDEVLIFSTTGIYGAFPVGGHHFGTRQLIYGGASCRPGRALCLTGQVTPRAGTSPDQILEIDMLTGMLRLFDSAPWLGGARVTPLDGFSTATVAGRCPNTANCELADADGDGRADLIIFSNDSAGHVYVAVSSATGFATPALWAAGLCGVGEQTRCHAADVDGDGRADLLHYLPSVRRIDVARGWPSASVQTGWHTAFGASGWQWLTADVNGDRMADVLGFPHDYSNSGSAAYVATSTASFEQ